IDVAATFEVPLTAVGDLHKLINDIKAGKLYELLSGMTNDDRIETMDAIGTICKSIQADNNNVDVIPCKRMTFPVVEYYARNNWAKHGLKRIMMNSKGFFFFKIDSRAGLEVVLEGGSWLIRKSPIILKKWSIDTRLLKEELTRILIWVKLHDVPIQVFEEDGISLIVTFIGKPVMLDSYKSSIWMISPKKPSVLSMNEGRPDVIYKTNDGFQTMGKKKKRKGKSKSTNGGQFVGPSVKQNVRYEPKATTSAPKKGVTNVGNTSQSTSMLKTTGYSSKKYNLFMSNSFSALNDEEEDDEEDVQNVYDESANLLQNIKAGRSSSFTATVG
ncbi:zinc knuckle CX2CX4HX4C containing protein, partial [Tanacetum coccineum]